MQRQNSKSLPSVSGERLAATSGERRITVFYKEAKDKKKVTFSIRCDAWNANPSGLEIKHPLTTTTSGRKFLRLPEIPDVTIQDLNRAKQPRPATEIRHVNSAGISSVIQQQ